MSQIIKGETFADGDQVTGAKLNQLVDQAVVTAEIITIQANMDAGTVASNDTMLVYDISETGLREANVSDVLGSNLPVITSSITGQATQISVLTSDITITPNDAEIVTGKNYTSADSSTIVVTSTAHGLAVGQIVQTSAASTGTFNGTFRIVAANTDTFTYTIPLAVLPSSGTFSSSNGTLVTVTTPVAHGLSSGNSVAFVTSNSAFNITTTITVVNSTSFTYSLGTVYGTGSGTFTSSNNQYTVVTTSSNHNLVDGTSIAVTASTGVFSGTYPITSLTATTFAYSIATPFGSANASSFYNSNAPFKITVTKSAHGLSSGNSIIVTCTSGNTHQNSYISGTHTITVVDANTFTYPKSAKITTSSFTPTSATLATSYVFSTSTTGTVTYVLGNPYTGSISYTTSPTGASGTLSYLKKGVVKNTNSNIINGNLYVDGTTTLNSDIRLVGNMTNFGSLTQNGAVTQNGTVNITGEASVTTAPTNGNHITNKTYVDGTISKTSNGYLTLSNGLILQWGSYTALANDGRTITLPIPFTVAGLFAVHNHNTTGNGYVPRATFPSISTIHLLSDSFSAGANPSVIHYWFAIGY